MSIRNIVGSNFFNCHIFSSYFLFVFPANIFPIFLYSIDLYSKLLLIITNADEFGEGLKYKFVIMYVCMYVFYICMYVMYEYVCCIYMYHALFCCYIHWFPGTFMNQRVA